MTSKFRISKVIPNSELLIFRFCPGGARDPRPGPERAVGGLEAGRGLLALECCRADQLEDAMNGGGIVARGDDFFGGLVTLDVQLQDLVEDVVRRQRVLV